MERRWANTTGMDLVGDLAKLEWMSRPVPVKARVGIVLAMIVVTGIVDAVSYLALGRVFTASMTAMGLRNAIVGELAVPEMTTTC
jgi:hypothetical protein